MRRRIDATTGPILPAIVALAWPTLLALSIRVAFNIVDIYWVARLGTDAVAAMSTSSFLYWMLMAASETFGAGTLALVARSVGARNLDSARRFATQGILWAGIGGVATGLLGLALAPAAFRLMRVDAAVATLGLAYMTPLLLGAPLLFVMTAADASFRGAGEPRTSLSILATTFVLNAVLDPVLIFGWGPVPPLGVSGAAVATVFAFAVGAMAALVVLHRGRGEELSLVIGARPKLATLRRIVAIGLPPASAGMLFALVYVLLTGVTSRFGTAALAALGIGHKLESPAYLTSVALAHATATAVGQCLGAGLGDRARATALAATRLAMVVAAVMSAIFILMPEPLVALFSGDARVVAIGSSYLRIAGYVQVMTAVEMVLGGAFAGAGDTTPPMLVRTSLTLIRVPLAGWLALGTDLGVDGVFWAIGISAAAKGVAMALWFRRGGWLRKEV